jgi:protocatechuate 3,4-dioxygenase beta subunit
MSQSKTASTSAEPHPTLEQPGRRELLGVLGLAALGLGASACGGGTLVAAEGGGGAGAGSGDGGAGPSGSGPTRQGGAGGGGPTPSCEEETESDIEGPFYTENAPTLTPDANGRVVLSPTMPGERVVLAGRVFASGCEPLAGAEIDLWQADEAGVYDNVGYTLRGKVLTASDGSFAISTVLPGRYLNGSTYRPRHLHLKLRAAGHRLLTTQLYFPGDPFNESDAFFDARLLVNDVAEDGERYARFDFVLASV